MLTTVLLVILSFGSSSAQTPSAAIVTLVPQYDLTIRVLPEAHRLEASGTIKLPGANAARESFQLSLSDIMQDLRVEILEPASSAGIAELKKGQTQGGATDWAIYPPRPIPQGESVRLRFTYAGGEKISFVFYLGPEGSFAGGSNTAWFPQVEGEARGTGKLRFSVPAGYVVVATGTKLSTSEEERRGDFQFELSQPASFSFAAAKYTVLRRGGGAVPVTVYLLRPRENINKYLDGCSKILDFLVRQFGTYPYGEFALVEAPSEQAGKANFSGAGLAGFILSDSTSLDREFSLAFYGHEIGHMWWGNSITVKGERGLYMLSEAMAQFGSLLAVEAIEGADAAERYRRTGYPGYGTTFQSGLGYLKLASAGLDYRLDSLPRDGEGSDSFYRGYISHELADGKGFLALDLLSHTVGREKFRGILGTFTREHAFQSITWEEFLHAVEAGAGSDPRWFFAQWFERTGAPDWQLTWKQEKKVLQGVITQSAPYYRASVEVLAEGADCRRVSRLVELDGPRTEFALPVKFPVRSVVLDPHFLVLHWTPEYRAEATGLAPYYRVRITKKSDGAEEQFKTALQQVPTPDLYGLRFWLEYGRALELWDQKKLVEAKEHMNAALASPARPARGLPRLYLYLARVSKELQDDATMRWAAEAAITAAALTENQTGVADEARALLQNRSPK